MLMWVNCPICSGQFEHNAERALFAALKSHIMIDHDYSNKTADVIAKAAMRDDLHRGEE